MKTVLMTSACNPVFWALVAFASPASAQTAGQLIPHNVKLESADYLGKRAVRITEDGQVANGEAYAVVKDAVFHNGAIEVELAGRPASGSAAAARGFIGIAFRLQNDRFEYIYLRPTNGRADDQVRRNHLHVCHGKTGGHLRFFHRSVRDRRRFAACCVRRFCLGGRADQTGAIRGGSGGARIALLIHRLAVKSTWLP